MKLEPLRGYLNFIHFCWYPKYFNRPLYFNPSFILLSSTQVLSLNSNRWFLYTFIHSLHWTSSFHDYWSFKSFLKFGMVLDPYMLLLASANSKLLLGCLQKILYYFLLRTYGTWLLLSFIIFRFLSLVPCRT